jgi:hypothetical protein
MNQTANSRIALYKEAIALEEKRATLQSELDRLLARLSDIKDRLFDADGVVSTDAAVASAMAKRSPGRARRGELKDRILSALSAAGSAGVRVKDLASTLGAKVANIHSWFQTSSKRIPQIKKVGEARYRLDGALSSKDFHGKKSTVKAAKPNARAKTTKSGKPRKSTRPLSKRGELATKIISALREAGPAGLKVRTLADKIGVNVKNLYIWFATTGRKHDTIKKIGESLYRIEPGVANQM